MASLVDYEDSDEEASPPVACVTEERDRPNNMCSEASSSNASCLPIRSHFIGMGYNASLVDEAIQEVGSANENSILEYIKNNQECSSDSEWCSIKRHFVSMGFSSTIVDKALEECGTEDEAIILDFLTNYKGSSCESSLSSIRKHFMLMGFSSYIVDKAIEERGTEDEAAIFESILTYELLMAKMKKSSSDNEDLLTQSESSESEVTDTNDEDIGQFDEEINLKDCLLEMGYAGEEVSLAIERYGVDIPIDILIDSIDAVRHSQATGDGDLGDPYDKLTLKKEGLNESHDKVQQIKFHKRKHLDFEEDCSETHYKKPFQKIKSSKGWFIENEDTNFRLPQNVRGLVGFGVPGHPVSRQRKLKEFVQGPPYFYFENVYGTPKGVWETISRFLYDIEPEFVDSSYFSVSSRKRGYVHNLPIDNRFQISPLPPMTIQEAFPEKQKFWPSWDKRTKLNCINTVAASVPLCDRLRDIVKLFDMSSAENQGVVLFQCRKWNLVWVLPDQLAPLEPQEMELVLGFDVDHTRVSGKTERVRSLGNAFQVETVAYHLSVLKPIYPNGINVLSLFSGIGGAEVALHRLGIPLNYVVSAEMSKENRLILRSWWEKTYQKGKLIEVGDVQNLTNERLDELINSIGGFDLIIGGSPCNNLTGSNRCTRIGLEGEKSSIFFEFPRIVKYVRRAMHPDLI